MRCSAGVGAIALMVAAAVASAGCAPGASEDQVTGFVLEPALVAPEGPAQAQWVRGESPRPYLGVMPDEAAPDDVVPADLPADPCDCWSYGCLQEWVVSQLGCDVCMTFVCGGAEIVHVCAHEGAACGPPILDFWARR